LNDGYLSSLPMLDSLYGRGFSHTANLIAISLLCSDTETERDAVDRFNPSFLVIIDPEGKLISTYANR